MAIVSVLIYANPDRLVFEKEEYRFISDKRMDDSETKWSSCGYGHAESHLPAVENATARAIVGMFRQMKTYQFHHTGETARMRGNWSIDDGRWLKDHAENLGSFLYRLHREDAAYYLIILRKIRLLLPFFDDFEWRPALGQVLLRWKEQGSNKVLMRGRPLMEC